MRRGLAVFESSAPLWAVLASPLVGSFLGVVVSRHASPRSIVLGRSRCGVCRHPLGPLDLVPLASWVATRGRCRYCGGDLGLFYPMIELAALAVALWSAALGSGWLVWETCLFGWTLLALAAIDVHAYRLPDFLTIPLLLGGLGLTAFAEPTRFTEHLFGAAAGYSIVIVIRFAYRRARRREGIGLGDAKLLAAAGAWGSWESLPSIVLVGAVAALIWVLFRLPTAPRPVLTQPVPFGAFLCLGTWLICLYGPLG
jgi:leader peptidase (prepilin peptidase)/N-methyltransferase